MKNWMFILADVAGLAVIILIFKSFFVMFGEKRWDRYWGYIIADVAFIALGTIINIYKINQITFAIAFYLIIFLYSFVYIIKSFKRVYSTVLCYATIIISEVLMGLLMSYISKTTVEDSLDNIVYYVLNSIVSKLILYVVIKVISSYVVCKNNSIPKVAMIAFIVLPINTFLMLYFISEYVYTNNNRKIQIIMFVISLLLIISNVIVFFILDYISKQKDKEKIIETQKKQLEYERQYYSDLYEKQVISDKVSHDLKNKFIILKKLIKENPARVEREIDEITSVFNETVMMKITGNVCIDSLLNYKISLAKKNSINIEKTCIIGNIEKIDIIDLCVIIGNLIDNSIEACLKIPDAKERYVKINIKQEMKYLQIKLTNSYIKEIMKGRTSKKDNIHHGFGMQNVKELVEKYDGYYTFLEGEGEYTAIVGVKDTND